MTKIKIDLEHEVLANNINSKNFHIFLVRFQNTKPIWEKIGNFKIF